MPIDVSLADQIACVQREIAMRQHVYPRWISAHRITRAKGDAELAAMGAVLATLQALQEQLGGPPPPDQGALL
jgi:hypothetical protein